MNQKKPLGWGPGMCVTDAPENAYPSARTTALKRDRNVFPCQGQTAMITSGKIKREEMGTLTMVLANFI